MVPTRKLGIWHKRPPLPSHPPLVTTPQPTPVQNGHLSPSLEIRHPALFPEDRPTAEATQGGESRSRSARTHRPGKHTHTRTRTTVHTQLTQTHRPSPVPEAWEDRFRIRVVFLQALALFYLATEGVKMLCIPFSRQQECMGAEQPDLTFGVWHYPHPWPACSLWHLQANVHLPVF